MRPLLVLPVYNEREHLPPVLAAVRPYGSDILVVDDGSTDGTAEILRRTTGITVLTHQRNEGYGAALREGFLFGLHRGYDAVLTMDVDWQHEPQYIPALIAALHGTDVVSGSRYLRPFPNDVEPPAERQRINREFTHLVNARLGLSITDAFCGFKVYSRRTLECLEVTEPGYGMPLEMWVQIAHYGLRVQEVAVPRIYLPGPRTFGGAAATGIEERRRYYHEVFRRALTRRPVPLPNLSPSRSAV